MRAIDNEGAKRSPAARCDSPSATAARTLRRRSNESEAAIPAGLRPARSLNHFATDLGIPLDSIRTSLALEHVIPRSVLRDEILNSSRTKNDIIRILCASGGIVIVHREEDRKLTENGLRRRMPKSWRGIGDNPFKRYEAAGIYMSNVQIENCGPICL